MKRSKFTDSQFIEAIKRVEAGLGVLDNSLRPTGCGPTITNARTWHWADSPRNNSWQWLLDVSSSGNARNGGGT